MMCGLYGFLGEQADAGLLAELAHLADSRGGHAHGWATPDQHHKARGLLRPDSPLPTGTMIGHARLATSGSYSDLDCAGPLISGMWRVAHNGTVPHFVQLAAERGWSPPKVDSALLPALLARMDSIDEITATIEEATRGVPLALLALRSDGLLVAARRGHPLYTAECTEGHYFCSLPFEGAKLLPDQSVHVYRGADLNALTLPSDVHLRRHAGGPQWMP